MTVYDDEFISPSTTETQFIGGNVNAYGVQIRFQASDLVRPTSTVRTSHVEFLHDYLWLAYILTN